MPATTVRRLLSAALRNPNPFPPLSSLHRQTFSFSSPPSRSPEPQPPTRSRTPLESQFETWVETLKPGFTTGRVEQALLAQRDPDLALDIFRWTAQQRHYKHTHQTYLTIFTILIDGGHFRQAETVAEEIYAGACEPSLTLYNAVVRFCCGRKFLFNRAFDVYKKMLGSEDSKPNLETFTLLYTALLRRFNTLNVCYVYLRAVRSLTRQMKSLGVVPDAFVLNMIVKAFAKCGEMDEAVRVYREMGIYGCEPNAYTYGYIAKGLCEKGRVGQGFGFYEAMKAKGFVPGGSCFAVVICGLALEGRLEDATGVVFEMLGCSMSPDLLTYKTVLEGLCRSGRSDKAVELLEEFRRRDRLMSSKTFNSLLNQMHFDVGRDG